MVMDVHIKSSLIYTIQAHIQGQVKIAKEVPDAGEITLSFNIQGSERFFSPNGSISGVKVESTGIEPPYENHGQLLLHGKITLKDA